MKLTKMIKVTSRGYVMTSRGRVLAPIRTPYRESVSKIWSMITSDRADVWEKLPNGEFIQLTPLNFDKDNSKKEDKKVENTKPVENKVKEPAPETVNSEIKIEEPFFDNNVAPSENQNILDEISNKPIPTTEVKEEVKVDVTEETKDTEPVTNNNQNKNGYNKKNKHNKPNQVYNQNKTNVSDIAVTPEEV